MTLLLQFTVLLSLTLLMSHVAKRIHFPHLFTCVITGILLGSAGFALIDVQGRWYMISQMLSIFFALYLGFQLPAQKLWDARKKVFGLSSLTVLGSSGLLALLSAVFLESSWSSSLLIGIAFSLSANHFILNVLDKKQYLYSALGQEVLALSMLHSILLIPSLMLLQVSTGADTPYHALAYVMLVIAFISALLLFGRYVLQSLLRAAAVQHRGTLIATIFAVICAVLLLAESVGIHLVLAAFLAGMLVSDSEYRPQIQQQLDPLQYLVITLFFVMIGAHLHWPTESHAWLWIMAATASLLLIKLLLSCLVGHYLKWTWSQRLKLGLLLAQAGELSFLLLVLAKSEQLLNQDTFQLLLAVLLLSYGLSNLIFYLLQYRKKPQNIVQNTITTAPLIIAGFGRVGQLLARVAHLQQHSFVAIDNSIGNANFVQHYGGQLLYADATVPEVLQQAGLNQAELFILAIDDIEDSLNIARYIRLHYPQLNILARARDRHHVHLLKDLGIEYIWRESYASSLEMAYRMLCDLGGNQQDAKTHIQHFRRHDEALLQAQQHLDHTGFKYYAQHQNALAELQHLFAEDAKYRDNFVSINAESTQD